MQVVKYNAQPTLARFHASDAPIRGVMGPLGSGKSVACCMEILYRAKNQKPDHNGYRKTRWAVIRQTYPELTTTTLNTWKEWIPEEACPIKYGFTIYGRMRAKLRDKTVMDMEVYFLAVEKPRHTKKLLGLELTGAWINEAREVDKQIVVDAFSRTGRYPPTRDGAQINWSGVIMDTNPPDDDSWWYKLAEHVKPSNWQFFSQPGALKPIRDNQGRLQAYEANTEAENVKNQPKGFRYWKDMTEGADPEWVLVHCCGQYGSVFEGKPVYQYVYNDHVHVSPKPLGMFRGLPIFLGWDFGLTPACIVGQLTPNGQLRILREFICSYGGIKQFATDVVKPALSRMFPNMPVVSAADPAGNQKSQVDELTCLNQLESLGIPTHPAPTNEFIPRRQAVIDRLTHTIDGEPGMILDPSCRMLRRGFIGGYKFERVQVVGEERYKDQPAKNKFSHPHDALQYLVTYVDTVKQEEQETEKPPPEPEITWTGMV